MKGKLDRRFEDNSRRFENAQRNLDAQRKRKEYEVKDYGWFDNVKDSAKEVWRQSTGGRGSTMKGIKK